MTAVVTNGSIDGVGQSCVTDCNRTAELRFAGTVSPDETAAGTVDESIGFVFTSSGVASLPGLSSLAPSMSKWHPSMMD